MKPQLLKVTSGLASSFSMRHDQVPFINNRWHCHPELELIYFKNGSGAQFIGDNIGTFESGDVILVGSHLPHYWRFDDRYFESNAIVPNVYVAHFCDNFWGKEFLSIPENLPLAELIERSKRGIKVNGPASKIVGGLLEKMLLADGCHKVLFLLEALITIANSNENSPLSSLSFQPNIKENDDGRINSIYRFSMENYKRKINMEEIASVANMSPNSFCRYFKSKTRKTYSSFLLEIRVGIACKFLIENKISIKQICFESGFNNYASFHKYFKMITHKTPLSYQREYISKNTN
jgi:AraC-like DNA-binding protein